MHLTSQSFVLCYIVDFVYDVSKIVLFLDHCVNSMSSDRLCFEEQRLKFENCPQQKESDEKLYQDALINALGEFADHLPDFQKIDIMMFIVSKIPNQRGKATKADCRLQSILLKSLLKVSKFVVTIIYV